MEIDRYEPGVPSWIDLGSPDPQGVADFYGALVCTGVLAIFAFQVFENIGMTLGIMPVAGIPLPFMSYGGSSLLTSVACVALVSNVYARRFE